jgi:predicted metal-binding protein
MTKGFQPLWEHLRALGATHTQVVPAGLLVPEERIRTYCYENKCGCYGNHLTCPPHAGTIPEVNEKLKAYKSGILVQYAENIDVRGDNEAVRRTKLALHRIVLETEDYLGRTMALSNLWGLIGGSCGLCEECAGFRNEPCPFPHRARFSLEAIGIDVITLLGKLALDNQFRDDKITWTGMVLFGQKM